MDETPTPVTAWLAFSLAFDNSARHCHYIRQSQPSIKNLGQILQQYLQGSNQALEQALGEKLSAVELQRLRCAEVARKIEQALQWCDAEPHHHLIGLDHPCYPALLQDTDDAPILLYAKGSINVLQTPKVAIVGARKASVTATRHARDLASGLAERGITIVSGLALGIDAAAHQGALDVNGRTIAVAATEADTVYPKRHQSLARQIVEHNGLIVTEYPLGAPTLRWYFPRRNRIISGMCRGVLVAEAALPSGTLTTATHAMNQGREVMAVPGSVRNAMARGCHWLIKQGAALVETDIDVLDALGPDLQRDLQRDLEASQHLMRQKNSTSRTEISPQEGSSVKEDIDLTDVERAILMHLSGEPASTDDLMTQLNLEISELSAVLGMLEIRGKISSSASGRYVRC